MKKYYNPEDTTDWQKVTDSLVTYHPLSDQEIVDVVLKSWNDIFNSQIGSFYIGKEIFPTPQIMSFLLHELVAHYLSLKYKHLYRVGVSKNEKDIHHLKDESLSVEIKASSHPNQIFGNRSYAQPSSGKGQKDKNGYYITINFEKFPKDRKSRPEILVIRFGYLEHTDWIAQKAATGQQARLAPDVYKFKLKTLYTKT
jgi:hypothetical protein